MTGLLAFNSRNSSQRTGDTGIGLPKTYSRKRSLNAKYDRILGNTHSMRTGRGSTQTLAEVGEQFWVREEEEKEKVKKDKLEMYRRLGIKMPAARVGRDLNGGVGVMAKLEKYRLGNIPPPRGKTPPVELDEKLRRILYPPPPPPTPPAPTPPPIQLLSEQCYPSGSRVGKMTKSSSKTRPSHGLSEHHQPAHYSQQTPLRQVHYPPPPPQAPAVNGWIFTPHNGWIYIPPPQPYYNPQGGYPEMPPPPPFPIQQNGIHQAYPSPYSDTSHQEDPEVFHPHHVEESDPESDDKDQVQPFPKSILRDTTSSETSGHGRSVKFRDTPDFASPELFYRNREMLESPGFEPDVCSPSRWTLHKPRSNDKKLPEPYSAEDHGQYNQVSGEGGYVRGQEGYGQPGDRLGRAGREVPTNDAIPALLATAHQQLLSGHGIGVPKEVSGKRTGRDLVRNLENMAEQFDAQRGGEIAGSPGDRDEQRYHVERTPGRAPDRNIPLTPHRQASKDESVPHLRRAEPDHNDEIFKPSLRKSSGSQGVKAPSQHVGPRRNLYPADQHDLHADKTNSRAPETSPHHQPQTPHRQIASNSRLPPPSQNWRESQRPQMAFSQVGSSSSQVAGSQSSAYKSSQDLSRIPKVSGTKRLRGLEDKGGEGGEDRNLVQIRESDRHSQERHTQSPSDHFLSQDYDSQYQSYDQDTRIQSHRHSQVRRQSSSSQAQSPLIQKPQRHRLTDLELPLDIVDPSDTSYHPPSNSFPAEDEDEDEEYEHDEEQSQSTTPDLEPGKRVRLTEGAWAKYDIPQDKLPLPRLTVPPSKRTRPAPILNIDRIKNENENRNQNQSQISQIEQSDEEDDSWLDEDIDESLSQVQSDFGKAPRSGKLSTIAEEDEEEEEMEGKGGEAQVGWVEEGFFGEGGQTGFTIWRDQTLKQDWKD